MSTPRVEELETRRLFVVTGTAGGDVIEVQSVTGNPLSYRVLLNGAVAEEKAFSPSTLSENRVVVVNGLRDNDLITMDRPSTSARALWATTRSSSAAGRPHVRRPDDADKILGGTGTDSAAQDDKDAYELVEMRLT